MKLSIASLFILFLFIYSCKNESSAEQNGKAEKVEIEKKEKAPTSPINIDEATLALKQEKPLSAYAIQFYTNLMWHFDAAVVIKNPEKSKDYIGKWINFLPDNTIETGYYDGPVTKGKWALDEANDILTILEEGESPSFSQWKIKTSSSSDAIMIWVGTNRFGQNNTQIKMQRYNGKPQKGKK